MAKKAVLIFDMPETCNGCPCMDDEDYCMVAHEVLEKPVLFMETRPSWCPLIEVTKGDITRARMYLNRLEYAKEDRL